MVQTCNPSAQEGETGESGIPNIAFTKKKKKKKRREGGTKERKKEGSKRTLDIGQCASWLPCPHPSPEDS